MTDFKPFDEEYNIDATVLTEDIPSYLEQSLRRWINTVFSAHSMFSTNTNRILIIDGSRFLHPLQETFRRQFQEEPRYFYNEIFGDVKLLRNVLSYILQNVTDINEAHELETILKRSSSAYAVEFIKGEEVRGLRKSDGTPMFKHIGCKLVRRVAPIVKKQAEDSFADEGLLSEAWDAYYGLVPDDEKVVTRATDALSGALRDKFFSGEKRPVFGTIIQKIKQNPSAYILPASTIYDQEKFLDLMKEFSKIRGNHQKGTGRKPTHEEAGFVLHFSIMLYQILRNKP